MEDPDAQWKLLFALSRYGGLRCPSEHLRLKWADVDWEKNRILVHSPKTERNDGGDCRFVPLFPELRPYLLEAFEQAEEGTEYVITRCRDSKTNLRTQMERIIKWARVKPWPKLFHNLRASRESEFMREYDPATVCKWIGNSPAVAAKHYAMSVDLDDDFQRAAGRPCGGGGTECGTVSGGSCRYRQGSNQHRQRKSPGFTERFRAISMLT